MGFDCTKDSVYSKNSNGIFRLEEMDGPMTQNGFFPSNLMVQIVKSKCTEPEILTA